MPDALLDRCRLRFADGSVSARETTDHAGETSVNRNNKLDFTRRQSGPLAWMILPVSKDDMHCRVVSPMFETVATTFLTLIVRLMQNQKEVRGFSRKVNPLVPIYTTPSPSNSITV